MALLNLVRVDAGQVGVKPGEVAMLTTDNLATITAAGYLNNQGSILNQVQLSPLDVIKCFYSYNQTAGTATYAILTVAISSGVITLTAWDNPNSEPLPSAQLFVGNASGVAQARAITGDIAITNTGVTSIAAGAIVNADVNAAAAIAFSKLAALTSGNILVGSAGNVATSVAMSGDVAIDNAGATTIQAGAIDLAMLSAGITPSHVIKFAGQPTTVGGAAAEAFAIPGVLVTDLAFVQIVNDGTANVTVLQAVCTADTLTVTFNADPGNDTVFNYQIIRAAS